MNSPEAHCFMLDLCIKLILGKHCLDDLTNTAEQGLQQSASRWFDVITASCEKKNHRRWRRVLFRLIRSKLSGIENYRQPYINCSHWINHGSHWTVIFRFEGVWSTHVWKIFARRNRDFVRKLTWNYQSLKKVS